jgi:hypothetical protein
MTVRTRSTSVTFLHPFFLKGVDGVQPPGTYAVETDEEQILGLSFPAYRRIATTIVLPGRYGGAAVRQVVTIDPADLEAALQREHQACLGAAQPAPSDVVQD